MLHTLKKYYLIYPNLTEVLLTKYPEGWKESKSENSYNERYKTNFRTYQTQSLVFYFDAAQILKTAFDTFGTSAVIGIRIETRNSNYGYDTTFEGTLDFNSYDYSKENKSISIDIDDVGDVVKFTDNEDVKIRSNDTKDIEGNTIIPPIIRDVLIQPQNLQKLSEADIQEDKVININDLQTNDLTMIGVDASFSKVATDNLWLRQGVVTGSISNYELNTSTSDIVTDSNTGEINIIIPDSNSQGENQLSTTYIKFKNWVFESTLNTDIVTEITFTFTFRVRNEAGTLIDTYDFTQVFLTDGGFIVFNMDFNKLLNGELILQKGQKLTYQAEVDFFATTQLTNWIITNSTILTEVTYSKETTQEDKIIKFQQKTIDILVNNFTDEVIFPSNESEEISNYFDNGSQATRNMIFRANELTSSAININIEGATSVNAFVFTIRNLLRHYNEDGSVKTEYILWTKDITSLGITNVSFLDSGDINPEIARGERLVLVSEIVVISGNIDFESIFTVTITSDDTNIQLREIPPPADTDYNDGYLVEDILTHCMNSIVGENKIVFGSDLFSSISKDELNSLFGLILMRGSMIRGFDAETLPLSVSFGELFDDLNKLFTVGMYYDRTINKFVIDYLENIYETPVTGISGAYDLGDVVDLKIKPDTSQNYKTIRAGNTRDSGIEDYYVKNEGHNDTTYSTPLLNTSNELDLRNTISTDATDIELTRRFNFEDTEDISRDNDNTLYFLKCYDLTANIYTTEKSERIDIATSPVFFADMNLCLLPRYIVENNTPVILPMFYKNIFPNGIKYMQSKYEIVPKVVTSITYSTPTPLLRIYKEQEDVSLATLTRDNKAIYYPELYGFERIIDTSIINAIKSNPHRIWKINNTDYVYIKENGSDPILRESSWETLPINSNRL